MVRDDLLIIFLVAAFLVGLYAYLCLSCIAFTNSVSQEEYAQMTQQLVLQSIK